MFKIGDFSKIAQVSVKTLRYYAEMDLFAPARVDRFTSYRYYTVEQLPLLNRILALKELGFSLEQIKRLLRDDLTGTDLRNMVLLKKTEIENQIADEQVRLRRIEARLKQIELEGKLPAYEIVLRQIPSQFVAGIRREIPAIEYLPALFSELHKQLTLVESEVISTDPRIAIFYDAEYRESDLDIEAAIPVTKLVNSSAKLSFYELPFVENMACTVCQEGMLNSSDAYRALLTWIDANGYQTDGPARGVYLQMGETPESSEDLVVEMQFPIQLKPRPQWISIEKEQMTMESKIVNLPAFTVVGMLYNGKNQKGEIGELWGRFSSRIAEIRNIKDGCFGLCEPPDESGAFRYLAGMSVSSVNGVPAGMDVWNVPAQTYAVFICTLPTIGQTYQYVYQTWLPQSKYQYVAGIDFEYYDEDFNSEDENSTLKIYVPVQEKKS